MIAIRAAAACFGRDVGCHCRNADVHLTASSARAGFFAERDRRRKVQHAARRGLRHAGALLDLIDLAENAVALDAIDARLPRLITLREQSYAV